MAEIEIPSYEPARIEPYWQRRWEELGLFRAEETADGRPKYYCLMMFPYPSGDRLHVGHGRNYILGDVVVRYKIMTGHRVLSPMGWDAFGLPAENDALTKGIPPWVSVRRNIEGMKRQFAAWGLGYDWRRELATCDPGYYRWTQWLFLELYRAGLAYRAEAPVNWCPGCQTVLANEQVEPDGTCERCGNAVHKRRLTQWFFRITRYADRLLDDLERLGRWPERVKLLQQNWIGRSPGTRIEFRLDGGQVLPVFTTRPDTLGGVTFIALAPEHPLLERAPHAEARAFAARVAALPAEERASAESGRDKEGMPTGLSCTNPLTGERVPIWVASYALMEYGTGAVMGVPAHDQRDFEFARRHGLPIRVVIRPPERELDPAAMTEAYVEPGIMVHTGPEFDGLPSEQGKQRITEWLAARGAGRAETQYRMRDWLISRQRYWGAPIPIVHCARCGEVPVPEQALPVLLPHDAGMEVEVRISGTGRSPLAAMPQWVQTSCPRCGESAERETDTMDTFVDSAWYFLRFTSPHDERHAFSPEAVRHWMPVDQYIGGAEHATKHLIYARFITKVLADLGHLPFDEPFTNLFSQGLICRRAPATGRLEKMSKSKGNVVNPDELIARYGADTQRLYTLFIGPPERDAEWQDDDITGCAKFLQRLWAMAHEVRELAGELPAEGQLGAAALQTLRPEAAELLRKTHETIAKVTHDMEHRFAFNTAVAALMELLNQARAALQLPEPRAAGERQVLRWWCEATVRMLAPMAPHIAEELWQALGHRHDTVFRAGWPEHDPELARPREVEIAVQINGKVRGHERVPADLGREELERRVLASERVQRLLEGRPVRRAVVVPNKLVNLVVG